MRWLVGSWVAGGFGHAAGGQQESEGSHELEGMPLSPVGEEELSTDEAKAGPGANGTGACAVKPKESDHVAAALLCGTVHSFLWSTPSLEAHLTQTGPLVHQTSAVVVVHGSPAVRRPCERDGADEPSVHKVAKFEEDTVVSALLGRVHALERALQRKKR